jgi:hypothetical protein
MASRAGGGSTARRAESVPSRSRDALRGHVATHAPAARSRSVPGSQQFFRAAMASTAVLGAGR